MSAALALGLMPAELPVPRGLSTTPPTPVSGPQRCCLGQEGERLVGAPPGGNCLLTVAAGPRTPEDSPLHLGSFLQRFRKVKAASLRSTQMFGAAGLGFPLNSADHADQ